MSCHEKEHKHGDKPCGPVLRPCISCGNKFKEPKMKITNCSPYCDYDNRCWCYCNPYCCMPGEEIPPNPDIAGYNEDFFGTFNEYEQ